MSRRRIGELLVSQGALDAVQLESALAHQRRWGGRLGRSIVHLGFLKERAVLEAVGSQLGVPFVELGESVVPPEVVALLPAKLVIARRVLPIAREPGAPRGALVVALPDPLDLNVLDEVRFAAGMPVKPAIAAEEDLEQAIARHLGRPRPATVTAFASRPDAIELPEDSSPLTVLRRGGHGEPLN